MRVVDLFAGCGGLTLGAVEGARARGLRVEVALAVEIDATIRGVYRANFPTARVDEGGDVTAIFPGAIQARLTVGERQVRQDIGPVDLLVGGPPCQGHSDLNNHTRRQDSKNALYLRMVRAAEVLEPTCIAIENVPGVLKDRGQVVERAITRLRVLGYRVDDGVIPLTEIGVPQRRTRHLLLATKVGEPSIVDVLRTHRRDERSLLWAIGDLNDKSSDSVFDSSSTLSPDNARRALWMHEHDRFDLPNWQRPKCHRDQPDHRYKSMYGRLRYDQSAQTITTGFGSPGQGRYLHPTALRTLTPHEAARLQFFPDSFSFAETSSRAALARCIGNAVPPKLGFAVVRYLLALVAGVRLPIQEVGRSKHLLHERGVSP